MPKQYPVVLVIAGSDSGGGAGIQADIKTIASCGAYATTAITAITAQNTMGVQSVECVQPGMVAAQINSIVTDIPIRAVKIGMLGNQAIAEVVAETLSTLEVPIILDPVMFATSGDPLLTEAAMNVVIDSLANMATLVTPNIPEAEKMLGQKIPSTEFEWACKALANKVNTAVLLKGGHHPAPLIMDYYYNPLDNIYKTFTNNYINTTNTHGTGCTLSSAIAAHVAQNIKLVEAIDLSRKYLQDALISGANFVLGNGNGPVQHMFKQSTDRAK